MSSYADTSFLFSYYASDANSTKADQWRQEHPQSLPLTVLHRLELRNAFELAVFQKRITSGESAQLWTQIETDVADGLLVTPEISLLDVFQRAEALARDHTAVTGTRSLDILHVACAQFLASDEIATFDLRQVALANRLHLPVAAL
jgi:predicted nucleic acid-binding protein